MVIRHTLHSLVYKSGLAFALSVLAGSALVAGVNALPPQLPHMLYGALTLDGTLADDGTQIDVLVNHVPFTNVSVQTSEGYAGIYRAFVPTDDPDTPEVEGGVNGDNVSFAVPGYEIAQTTTFEMGRVENLDLSNMPFTTTFSATITGTTDVVFQSNGPGPGLVINANGLDLGPTDVIVRSNQACTTVAGETVLRCFDIAPTNNTGRDATITFYFYSSQLPTGQSCADLNVFHWNGNSWDLLLLDTGYGAGGRECSSDPHAIRVKNVSSFSAFVIKAETPTTATVYDFGGYSTGLPLALLSLLGIWGAAKLVTAFLRPVRCRKT